MNKMYRILGKRGRITIPYEIRQRVGFAYNDVLSFTEAPDGCTVMVKREKICDNCNGAQPASGKDEVTLFDFLNRLSDEQQFFSVLVNDKKLLFYKNKQSFTSSFSKTDRKTRWWFQ